MRELKQPTSETDTQPARLPRFALLLGIVLVALNLRPVLAGFGPLLEQMQRDLQASSTTMSLLTTIPLLLFGVLAPVAPLLARRRPAETVILACLAAITAGALLRAAPHLSGILLGTFLVGGGIAVANVLLPGLVKRDFPTRAGLMMGVYTTAVVTGATVASGLAVPLRAAFHGSWQASLSAWALLGVAGILAWLPVTLTERQRVTGAVASPFAFIRSALAWQVTAVMGLQSLVFYAWLTWLPQLLIDHGLTPAAAGFLLSSGNLVQLPFTLLVPVFAARAASQQAHAVGVSLLIAVGLLGLLVAPTSAPAVWVLLLGAGCGAAFALALTLIVLRAADNRQVASLSGMAQGAGYLMAASGPVLFGWLHDRTGGWNASLWLLLACTALLLITGIGAGRPLHVQSRDPA